MRYKVDYIMLDWPRLVEATAGPAGWLKRQETLWDHNRHSGRPKKLRVCFLLVGVDPTANFSTGGPEDLPSSGFHHPGLIRTR